MIGPSPLRLHAVVAAIAITGALLLTDGKAEPPIESFSFTDPSIDESSGLALEDGLVLTVNYTDAAGNPVDIARLAQGEDVTVDITLRNTTREDRKHIALTQIVASGWEIANDRLFDAGDGTGDRDSRSQYESWRNDSMARTDYVDIRDDRVMQFFDLAAGSTIRFQTRINAAYRGRYYVPGIVAEAMYDATQYARTAGRWTEVVAR